MGRLSGARSVTITVSRSEQSSMRVPTKSRPISAGRGGTRNQWVKARTTKKTVMTTQGAHIRRLDSMTLCRAIAYSRRRRTAETSASTRPTTRARTT